MAPGDVIECLVDTKNGNLGFSGNGNWWGWAYENIVEFKDGDLFFGVSMLDS